MKKFIDRMEAAQAGSSGQSPAPAQAEAAAADKSGKKRWGLGGMVRKVTGTGSVSSNSGEKAKEKEGSEGEEPSGLQVDFYLVIVSFPDRIANGGS